MRNSEKAVIKNFAVGLPENMAYGNGKEMKTAIRKQQVQEAFLSKDGFFGDGVADLKHHGGPERAVCIYPHEHYEHWNGHFETQLPRAAFGENLTVTNMLERDICIGDIFQIGEAVIQVTQGRVPCNTIDRRLAMKPLLKEMVKTGYTGYLCRVLEEGMIRGDSTIRPVAKNVQQVSVLYANEINFHRPKDIDGIVKVLEAEELADDWRQFLTKRLIKLTDGK
ncbi:MOSC domain-containing protein YiiM [Planomicrobium stackebrandtii]|uniref:MOSC domain-containing protein YiiM n=1 Tax=Planomicrobium stackebrandtii TaxID=253160 RepID=A0ABU0H0R3_9BACL|nr:MOSC domain-containing protein [Planomicrobium stackebrandtii]MDQ0430390.1 MOSC domain-containing protein YiiM [Planomicrobium stackebrandtii]